MLRTGARFEGRGPRPDAQGPGFFHAFAGQRAAVLAEHGNLNLTVDDLHLAPLLLIHADGELRSQVDHHCLRRIEHEAAPPLQHARGGLAGDERGRFGRKDVQLAGSLHQQLRASQKLHLHLPLFQLQRSRLQSHARLELASLGLRSKPFSVGDDGRRLDPLQRNLDVACAESLRRPGEIGRSHQQSGRHGPGR